jgi:hypothetical protein
MKILGIITIALAMVGAAQAYTKSPLWTVEQAEEALYESSWAERLGVAATYCAGVGRPTLVKEEQSFRKFTCEAEYDAVFFGDPHTCTIRVSVRPLTDKRISIVGNNKLCSPDQGYVNGNG